MEKLKLWHISDTTGQLKDVFDNIDYLRCDNIEDCDYILIPSQFTTNYHNQNVKWLNDINLKSRECGKPFIAFLHDDPTDKMDIGNGILFRTSFYKSKASKSEYALPTFDKYMDSFIPNDGGGNIPIIGFVGGMTHPLRHDSIEVLNRCPNILKKIIIRHGFHYHQSLESQQINTMEFFKNMDECQYQLCIRGAGNFSHRFYETMMCGRIPVVVDSDIPLPCEEQFDWNDYIVMAKTVEELPTKLIEWHNKNDVVQKQIECRNIWEKYLSPKGFAKYVESIITNKIIQ